MPRLYNGNGERSDFCYQHFPSEANARRQYGGEHFSYNAVHPDYMRGDLYYCVVCGCLLTAVDNQLQQDSPPRHHRPHPLQNRSRFSRPQNSGTSSSKR